MRKYPWYLTIVVLLFMFAVAFHVSTQTDASAEADEAEMEANESPESHAEHGPLVPVVDEGTKKILYWTCVMHPTVHMPDPGLCPVCGMDLIPVLEGAGLTLTEKQKALIPIRTETIGFHKLGREIRTLGILDYNETNVSYVSTRVSGWIQKLHVNFTGTKVKAGERLLDIYSPELLVAQEEYLLTIKNLNEIQSSHIESIRNTAAGTLRAAESRLELLGITKGQIQEIRKRGEVSTELPLYAPIGGTVVHMNVYNGQHVMRGMNMYKIADLSSLWLLADIYEYELPWVAVGQDVLITVQALPDQEFHGKVIFIYPYMDNKTRTVKVQVEVPNPAGDLRPGMYTNVRLKSTLVEIYTEIPAHSAHENAQSSTVWTCPMHPQIKQDGPGECPICGMDLVEEEVSGTADAPEATTIWTCPMHPQIKQDGPGECPICGMDLVEEEVPSEPDATERVLRSNAPLLQFMYACPDHPDKKYAAPGTCPEDGKALVMTEEVLSVPKSAVIDTGLRTIVFKDMGDAGYVQAEVRLGPESWAENGDARRRYFPIISGLFADDVVVTNGNYLLDSQTQLTGSGSAAGAYGGALGKEEDTGSSAP